MSLVQGVARHERHGALRAWMLFATRLADGWALIAIIPLALLVGGRRGVIVVACGAVSAVTIAVAVHAIKNAVRRSRPGSVGLVRPITARDLHAFPSGHTAHAFGMLVLAWWLSPWFGIAFVPIAISVGISRMFFGLHYLSDVVAGALLGAFIAGCTLLLARSSGFMDWVQAP